MVTKVHNRMIVGTETEQEVTWYVSPTGDDSNDGLSEASPLRTLQRAIDLIPSKVFHRQTIQLTNGIHNEGSKPTNPIHGASTIRTVRCLVDNKQINGREMIVIQGDELDNTLVVLEHNDVYSALYVEDTNGVVLQNVTIDCSSNPAAAISVCQHRRGDARMNNVRVLSNGVEGTHAFIVETGGFMEFDGDIRVENCERAFVALEGVMSFITDSIYHLGIDTGEPRTFEIGSNGQIYVFGGSLETHTVARIAWNKSGYLLLSPSSHASSDVTSYAIDAALGTVNEIRRLQLVGAERGVNCDEAVVLMNLCTFTDQTISAVYNHGGKVIIDDCYLTDTTGTKAIVDSEGGSITIKGDGDITLGFRGVYAKNTQVEIEEQANISGNKYDLDLRESSTRLLGTQENPITLGGGTTAILMISGSLYHKHTTINHTRDKTSMLVKGGKVFNGGGVNINTGYIGVDLLQNATYTAEDTVGSSIINMTGFGIRAQRGAQVYYRGSTMSFTNTKTPTMADAGTFARIVAF